jgi:ribosome-associated protein
MISLLTPDELNTSILEALDDKQAFDIKTYDMENRSSLSAYVIIASGQSSRQLAALADTLRQRFKPYLISLEGLTNCDWVIVDLGSTIVHLFRPDVRDFYELDSLWDKHHHFQ